MSPSSASREWDALGCTYETAMIYTLQQIRTGTGFQKGARFLALEDAKQACDPDNLESLADEIELSYSNAAFALRAIAKRQRALLEGHL